MGHRKSSSDIAHFSTWDHSKATRVHLILPGTHPPDQDHKEKKPMSEYRDAPKAHEPHPLHEEHAKGPHDLKEINPKMTSDIAYWSKEFGVTGDQLHEAIRSHGTHVEKVRAALHTHKAS
jgi:Protein of unknown function (DUF3606)